MVNFLQSEVKALLRKAPEETPQSDTNLLSVTVINELESTMQQHSDESDAESDSDDNENHQNLNDSTTKLKEVVSKEPNPPKLTRKSKSESSKYVKCCDVCKVKSGAKKTYDQIQCVLCTAWFHEICVGIKKEDPIGVWACPACRNVPSEVKRDLNCLKQEVDQIKQCTQSIVKAIDTLSAKLDNSIGGLNDRLTSVTRQINSRELCISESIDTLQTTTDNLKTSLDQKSCQILNKTTAVFYKVKTHTEKLTNNPPPSRPKINSSKPAKTPSETESGKTTKLEQQPRPKPKQQTTKTTPSTHTESSNLETRPARFKKPQTANSTGTESEPIDLTSKPTKVIIKSKLIVGSSILKRIKTGELDTHTAVRTFPGARTDSLKSKLEEFDLEKCKTIILHVGGNDADNGTDPESFCDSYISLLESLAADDRRIVVSGLTPRRSVDLEPYNDKLKELCAENDLEYIDNFEGFLLASGEIPETYFDNDKTHLNLSGTRKLLSNINKVCKVKNNSGNLPARNGKHFPPKRGFQGFRKGTGPTKRGGPRSPPRFCHICTINNHSTRHCWYNGRNTGLSGGFPY